MPPGRSVWPPLLVLTILLSVGPWVPVVRATLRRPHAVHWLLLELPQGFRGKIVLRATPDGQPVAPFGNARISVPESGVATFRGGDLLGGGRRPIATYPDATLVPLRTASERARGPSLYWPSPERHPSGGRGDAKIVHLLVEDAFHVEAWLERNEGLRCAERDLAADGSPPWSERVDACREFIPRDGGRRQRDWMRWDRRCAEADVTSEGDGYSGRSHYYDKTDGHLVGVSDHSCTHCVDWGDVPERLTSCEDACPPRPSFPPP